MKGTRQRQPSCCKLWQKQSKCVAVVVVVVVMVVVVIVLG